MILIKFHQLKITDRAELYGNALILLRTISEEISMEKGESLKIIEDMVMGI